MNLHARVSVFCIFIAASFFSPQPTHADVRPAGFFGDHMVLQQEMPIKVWGWAEPGEIVEVVLGENRGKTTADPQGKWSLKIPAMKASKQPLTMQVKGNQSVTPVEFKDILIGEVWLCSGQSNMEWTVRQCGNADAEIAAANHPLIRHLKIKRDPSPVPKDNLQAEWEICSPETVATFTATGYYTARNLRKELDVPIGLVHSSWGGTRIEPWTSTVGMQQVPALAELYEQTMKRTPGTDQHRKVLQDHIASIEEWLATTKANLGKNEVPAASPAFPGELNPLNGSGEPTALYNGMIHPLVGLPIRGVLWYQGESNRRDGMMYYEKKKALIQGWRTIWRQGEFPFFIVQIAPFQYGQENPEILAEFWEAQMATLNLPNTGIVITNDIATLNNIHPPNKQEVGRRLALLALKDVYGKKDLIASSPQFEQLEILPGKLKVNFNNTGGGLKTRDGNTPSHFELAGIGSAGFQPAQAVIKGDSVTLHSESVPSPTAFRFAWHKLAEPNLTGGSGLPVGAVRGGEIPSFMEMIPGNETYKLVYELDLNNLGRDIEYDIDNSADVGRFDRVGYLLELESDEFGEQKVFVSMNAFTDDIQKIGLPTMQSKASFQQSIESLQVFSNDGKLSDSANGAGNIEFWPNNYNQENESEVEGASDRQYDFGDQKYGGPDGYGSMQVHDFGKGTTIFAINHWSEGSNADIGIGNNDGANSDWTFTRNANRYTSKRLRVYVRQK